MERKKGSDLLLPEKFVYLKEKKRSLPVKNSKKESFDVTTIKWGESITLERERREMGEGKGGRYDMETTA